MGNKIQTSIYHDIRRLKKDGTYPVKLRLYDPALKKTKLYPLGLSYTKDEFDRIWNTSRPKGTYKDERMVLHDIEARAMEIVRDMNFLDLRAFERKFFRNSGAGSDVFFHFEDKISQCIKERSPGNADNYRSAMRSFKKYLGIEGSTSTQLPFSAIDAQWLKDYERHMLDNGKSLTTVGIYSRALRAIFNKAVDEGEIESDIVPFGKSKYIIPSTRKKRNALEQAELGVLLNAQPENEYQRKALDFFFLSYMLGGINLADIVKLRWKDIEGNVLTYVRVKTARTSRSNQIETSVEIGDRVKSVFTKYGTSVKDPNGLIFDICSDEVDDKENRRRRKNFIRFINQHLKKLTKSLGIESHVSYQVARHSCATHLIRKGYPVEVAQEVLGHKKITTTLNYYKGADENTRRMISEKLLEF